MSKTKRCISSPFYSLSSAAFKEKIFVHTFYISPAEYHDGENVYGRTAALGNEAVTQIDISQ